eukprot:579953_1
MSYRSIKKRRLDVSGKVIQTKRDDLNVLRSKNTNSNKFKHSHNTDSGYFLRSKTSTSRKRKLVQTIKEVDEAIETNRNNKENDNIIEPSSKKHKGIKSKI